MDQFTSDISNEKFPIAEQVKGSSLRINILEFIKKSHPDFEASKCLSISELNMFREDYLSSFIEKEVGALSVLEQSVIKSLQEKTTISDKVNREVENNSIGQRIADKVAVFGGSWTFIIIFLSILLIWIASNVWLLHDKGFDPYPFILLNLILSCIAALQAPVIMMSQNRQEEKDRERAKSDYMVNLKSELEIRILHEKVDHLIMHQEQSLIEIQRLQIDMMKDILAHVEKNNK